MLRTMLLLILVGLSTLCAVAIVDFFSLDRSLGDFLEFLFGSLSEENGFSGVALTTLGAAWLSYAAIMAIPIWRRRVIGTIWAWPIRNSPTTSFIIRTTVYVLGGLLIMLLLVNAAFFDPVSELMAIGFLAVGSFAFLGMVLHDFRGILLYDSTEHTVPQGSTAKPTTGWILPESITLEMLGQPALRYELAKDLRNRAAQMRRFSFFALAGIAALLVVAVNVILFAGFIANLGVGVTGPERIQQLLDSETLALASVQTRLRDLDARLQREEVDFHRGNIKTRANIRSLDDSNITDESRILFRKTNTYRDYLVRKSNLERVGGAHARSVEGILEERTEYLRKAIQDDFGSAKQADNLNLLIASGITRFGILFIMLFIVQVLVNLYRYTMRLSAYYLSQADALLLAEDNGEGLMKVVPVFSPQNVDFGKVPVTPAQSLEKVLELAAKLR